MTGFISERVIIIPVTIPKLNQEQRLRQAHERDKRAIELLDLRGVSVGQIFTRSINQADRSCLVFAVNGTRYAFSYEMPAGGIYRQIGDTRTGRERSVSLARLPQWAAEDLTQ